MNLRAILFGAKRVLEANNDAPRMPLVLSARQIRMLFPGVDAEQIPIDVPTEVQGRKIIRTE